MRFLLPFALLTVAAVALAADDSATPGRLPREARARHAAARAAASSPYDALWSDQFALPSLSSQVNAMIAYGGDIVMAGSSKYWGTTTTSNIARWDGTTWHPLGDGLPLSVYSLVSYGGQVVAGSLGVYVWDGVTWTSIGSANNIVFALVVLGTDLYAAGDFTTIGGIAAGGIARWDGASWHAVGAGFPAGSRVRALTAHGPLLVAGGLLMGFQSVAAWDGVSWTEVGAGLQGGPFSIKVNSLASDGSTLYAGGQFTASGATAVTKVAAWNGSTWSGLPGATSNSSALALYGGLLMATVPLAGIDRPQLWNGFAWQDFGGPKIQPIAFGLNGSTLYAYGLRSADPAGTTLPATDPLFSFDGSAWSQVQQPWAPNMMGVRGVVYAAKELNGALYLGGVFAYEGAQDRFLKLHEFAKWDGANWQSMEGVGGQVFSIQTWNNTLVAAADGQARKWTGSGWTTLGAQIDLWPFWLVSYKGDLIAIGTQDDATLPDGVARFDGSAWVPLGTTFNDTAASYLQVGKQWGNNLVVGGFCSSVGGVPARNCALWDGAAWHDIGGGANNLVYALDEFEGDLIVGGVFTEVGGDSIAGAARWDGSHWSPMGSNVREVYGLKEHGGRLFAIGEFLDDFGAEVEGAALWNGNNWQPLGSGIDPYGELDALEFLSDDLYMTGFFGSVGGHPSRSIARLPSVSALAAEPTHGGASLAFASAPNPSRGSVGLTFTLPAAGRTRVTIHDVAGRHVATLADGEFTAGPHALAWGAPVSPGLYFATLEAIGVRHALRIVRIE